MFAGFKCLQYFQDSVYQNIQSEGVRLEFDVCSGPNLTVLHTAMANQFWQKPSGKPSIDALMKPIWSTWAEYKKDINESKLLEYAQRHVYTWRAGSGAG